MSRPFICWIALALSLVAFGMSLAAFSLALVVLQEVN